MNSAFYTFSPEIWDFEMTGRYYEDYQILLHQTRRGKQYHRTKDCPYPQDLVLIDKLVSIGGKHVHAGPQGTDSVLSIRVEDILKGDLLPYGGRMRYYPPMNLWKITQTPVDLSARFPRVNLS